jgi:hypothetical protein
MKLALAAKHGGTTRRSLAFAQTCLERGVSVVSLATVEGAGAVVFESSDAESRPAVIRSHRAAVAGEIDSGCRHQSRQICP